MQAKYIGQSIINNQKFLLNRPCWKGRNISYPRILIWKTSVTSNCIWVVVVHLNVLQLMRFEAAQW